ncbi:MAG: hypothetical protein A2289_04895 [Deltaproteobacteria bacterium RIFOXYA12_FULL_58_15]|nr:MAG: hypothetical protein A2289_04895 [Deltaproteobacteria bacterium RIFOXYA12_FULL_58_15]OGR13234.1 MAG: hypothetical protein A2341_15380 [Deltaproteobacteria bacterium RIFOXYB12_FULL_58_9]
MVILNIVCVALFALLGGCSDSKIAAPDCVPNCSAKCCGDDGCGGDCTDSCAATNQICNAGSCECVCASVECNGICCAEGAVCKVDTQTCCQPTCDGKCCGDNGCGGTCPDKCSLVGEVCDTEGSCQCTCEYAICPAPVGAGAWLVDTRNEEDTYHSSANNCCITPEDEQADPSACLAAGGHDIGFLWRPGDLKGQAVNVVGWPVSYDGAIHIRAGDCDGAEVLCTDCNGYFRGCGHPRANDFVPTDDQYCIIVDKFSEGGGVGRLAIYASEDEEDCGNQADDDGDGQSDCDDWKCYIDSLCLSSDSECYEPYTAAQDFEGALWSFDGIFSQAFHDNTLDPSCGTPGGLDVVLEWIANKAGVWEIDTFGSDYDTVLWARRGTCGGEEIACNNDSGGLQSKISICAEEAEVFMIGADTNGAQPAASNIEVNATHIGTRCN